MYPGILLAALADVSPSSAETSVPEDGAAAYPRDAPSPACAVTSRSALPDAATVTPLEASAVFRTSATSAMVGVPSKDSPETDTSASFTSMSNAPSVTFARPESAT